MARGQFNNRQKDVSRVLREKFGRMKDGYKVSGTARDQFPPGRQKPATGSGEKPCGGQTS